jgi:peptidoglycan/LPS O-acetylase OafA/YrhL
MQPSLEAAPITRSGKTQASPHHFSFVDSLRGFAILGVLMVHVGNSIPIKTPRLRAITDAGENGVMLFFVVSAFTLFWSLRNRMRVDRAPLKAFFVRRFFRIAPLFWAGMVFYLIFPDANRSDFAPNGIGWPQIVTTFFFVHGWYPTTINSIVPGGWSIAAEVTFYFCIPILFKQIRTLCGAIWLAVITTGVAKAVELLGTHLLMRRFPASWRDLIGDFQYWIFPAQLPVFCLGIVLYFVLLRQMPNELSITVPKRKWAYCLLAVALVIILGNTPEQVKFAVAFVLLAWALATHHLPILVNPVTRFVGQVSYSIYIWHFFVLQWIAPLLLPRVHPFHKSVLNEMTACVVLMAVLLALSTVVAAISYHVIELPSQKLGKRLIQRAGWGASGVS